MFENNFHIPYSVGFSTLRATKNDFKQDRYRLEPLQFFQKQIFQSTCMNAAVADNRVHTDSTEGILKGLNLQPILKPDNSVFNSY